jgi:hypothetical protein
MLVVLGVGKPTATWALVELAWSTFSAVEVFVEVDVREVGVACTVSVKETHNIVTIASWWLLSAIMTKQYFRVQRSASFLRSYLRR